jgi:WXG100 family type VII secretion target
MPELRVNFQALADLQASIEMAIDAIETSLGELDMQVRWIVQVWDGAAAAGFQRAVTTWEAASADLRDQLTFLGQLVATAASNHANAVVANTRMWQV